MGNHEDPAPNLHLWKKRDAGLPDNERTSTRLPQTEKSGSKISQRTASSISLSFLHSVPAGQCCLTAGEESLDCSTESLLSMGTISSPGQQQPLKLPLNRSWRLIPVVLFHVKHRNFLEMAQNFSFSVLR